MNATRMMLAFLALVCAAGCATDPEYAQKLATARTDWKGNEIVGVWFSKLSDLLNTNRSTILFRPDGTGRLRWKVANQNAHEYDCTWHYLGEGRWQGQTGTSSDGIEGFTMNIRYTGHEILLEQKASMNLHLRGVFVPADNGPEAGENLKKRRQAQ